MAQLLCLGETYWRIIFTPGGSIAHFKGDVKRLFRRQRRQLDGPISSRTVLTSLYDPIIGEGGV